MAITRRGRRGSTPVPNWRIEDDNIDPFDLRVAAWLDSHAESYEGKINRNEIARRTSMSPDRASKSLEHLEALGIIETSDRQSGREIDITFDSEVWERGSEPDATRPVTGRHTSGNRTPHVRSGDSLLTTGETQGEASSNDDGTFLEAAEKFWGKYPSVKGRKVDKERVVKKFVDLCVEGEMDQLRLGFAHWLRVWADPREREYVPAPLRWLRSGMWRPDAIEDATEAEGPSSLAAQGYDPSTIKSGRDHGLDI